MSSEREKQNLRNLELGGVPVAAEERLRAQVDRPKPFFVANLSVNELSLMGRAGYHPAGQVMGSSVYHIGWQPTPGSPFAFTPQDGLMTVRQISGELEVLTEGHLAARDLALSRLQSETRLLGAHGVVGVKVERREYDWGLGLLEFSVMGTAIRIQGEGPTDKPFLSDLSGEEFYQLWQAGFKPVGFAYGNSFWYEVAGNNTWNAQNVLFGSNQELTDYTRAIKDTRDAAMGRMEAECTQMGATGVVGVKVERSIKTVSVEKNKVTRTDLTVHMEVTGTAIAPRRGIVQEPAASFAVSLADLALRTPV